jgi:hypothetical protein
VAPLNPGCWGGGWRKDSQTLFKKRLKWPKIITKFSLTFNGIGINNEKVQVLKSHLCILLGILICSTSEISENGDNYYKRYDSSKYQQCPFD